jgi:hypothetical protein
MKNILKNRTALSTVVTTLIILVVSVLLAGVVTYFAINVTSTRVQEESLNLMYVHIWDNTTVSQAALLITNTGGRDVVIDKLAVRGQTIPWINVFQYIPATSETVSELYYFDESYVTNATGVTWTKHVYGTNPMVAAEMATTPVANPPVLKSGYTIILYMATLGFTAVNVTTTTPPGSVTVNDVGLTVAISVFTAQATYIKETNVNAVS